MDVSGSLLSRNFILHKSRVINIHLFAAKMVLEKFARLRETVQTGEFHDWPVDVFSVERERVFIRGMNYSRGIENGIR